MKKGKKIKINCQKGGTYQIGGPIMQQPQPTQPNWFDIPKQPVQQPVPFTVNHEGVNKMKSKDKIYEKQEGGQMQFDQQVLGSYVRSLAPREQARFLQQWQQMDEVQKQELYQAIVQQTQQQPQMQQGGFVHPYDNDFYPEMQSGGAPIWNNLNATAYARNYKPSAGTAQNGVGNLATSEEVGIPPAADPFAGTTEKEVIKAAQTAVKQGSDVTRIQQALVDAGYKIKVDGVYGPKTQRAVENFQAANKLKVDGVVGQNTLSSLGLNYTGKNFRNTITKKAPVINKATSQIKEILDQNGMPVEITEVIDENGMPVESNTPNYYESTYNWATSVGQVPPSIGKSMPATNQLNAQPVSNIPNDTPWYYSLPSGQSQRPNSVLPMSAAAAVNQERPYNPDDPREIAFRETMGIPMSLVPLGGSSVSKAASSAGNYVAKNASKVVPAIEQFGETAAKYSTNIKTAMSEMLPKGTTYESFFQGGPSNTAKLVDYMVRTGKVAKSEANKLMGELSQYFRTAKPSSSDYSKFFE